MFATHFGRAEARDEAAKMERQPSPTREENDEDREEEAGVVVRDGSRRGRHDGSRPPAGPADWREAFKRAVQTEVRSIRWSPHDRVDAVNVVP
jgi:hypothetical protein